MLSLWLGLVLMLTVASLFIWSPVIGSSGINSSIIKQTACILTLLLIIPASLIYKNNGASQKVADQIALMTLQTKFGNLNGLIAGMEKRLAQEPTSVEGWYLLGKLYMHAAQYSLAVNALAKANQLSPGQPEILLNYKEAQRLAESQKQ